MSDLGSAASVIRRIGDRKHKAIVSPKTPIGIKTPLEKGNNHGETLFKMHFNISDQIKDNLKNLIMTQKGERLGFPDYGTNLRSIYSNTSLTEDQIADMATNEISNTVSKYMPNIRLEQFYSEISDADKKNDAANNTGQAFAAIQGTVSVEDSDIIELNKKNPNLNSVYKVSIVYSIPLLNSNDKIILYINNSK